MVADGWYPDRHLKGITKELEKQRSAAAKIEYSYMAIGAIGAVSLATFAVRRARSADQPAKS